MKHYSLVAVTITAVVLSVISAEGKSRSQSLNVLILTVDDMNCDSVGGVWMQGAGHDAQHHEERGKEEIKA
jgi:hypothetical protein